jgi:NADH-quinone oxidoreductase subunit A
VSDYRFLALFLAVVLVFPPVILLVIRIMNSLLGLRKPDPVKESPIECGMETIGNSWIRYNVRYYYFALIFVIFDVETVFLFPWAVAYKQLGWFALGEAFIFVATLVVGLIYAWRKKALRWV